jgi:hypothetical protein
MKLAREMERPLPTFQSALQNGCQADGGAAFPFCATPATMVAIQGRFGRSGNAHLSF